MSEKTIFLLFGIAACLLIVGCLPVTAADAGYFSGGMGTAEDPYLIATPADLMNLSWAVNNWAEYGRYAGLAYVVTAPIDMSGISEWEPIGVRDYTFPTNNYSIFDFHGVFNGNYQPITGLSGTAGEGSGLFYQTSGSVLKNIRLENISAEKVGLMSYASQTQIENCSFSGSLSGNAVGGLMNSGSFCTIVNCSVTGSVTGNYAAGGIALTLRDTTVKNCIVSAAIESDRPMPDDGRLRDAVEGTGGLFGHTMACTVEDSFFAGTVRSEGAHVGGLVGMSIDDSYLRCGSAGDGEGERCVGGLAGYADKTTFSDCFFAGNVHAAESVSGGFVGKADPLVSLIRCYTAGGQVSGQCSVGGIAGWMEEGTVEDCLILHQHIAGSVNVSAVIGREDTRWPVVVRNTGVWGDMVVAGRDGVLNYSHGVVPVSSADVWNVPPETGGWAEFSSEIWKQTNTDSYRLLVPDASPEMVMPDVRYLNSSAVPFQKTESSFPLTGLCTGFCLLGFLIWRRDRR
ncbi:MAG: hypothetical protein O0X49_00910 [Methanocorpusculum sp.]|nr:hypothetical protein [Methanocorpusculum sp.]